MEQPATAAGKLEMSCSAGTPLAVHPAGSSVAYQRGAGGVLGAFEAVAEHT